jgi:hypothetical protein
MVQKPKGEALNPMESKTQNDLAKKKRRMPIRWDKEQKKEIHEGHVIEAKEESPFETLYFLKKPPRVSIMPLLLPPPWEGGPPYWLPYCP